MMRKTSCILSVFLLAIPFLVALFPVAAAADKTVVNSADWKDVYSTMLYANLAKSDPSFLTSTRHSTILLYSLRKESSIEIITSRKGAFVVGYKDIMQARGFPNVTEYVYDNVNLELAQRLPDITRYIIIDPSYGYNALSAAPYAVVSNSYVLFVDARNMQAVETFLRNRKVDHLILFGQLDREVKDALASYDPEIINEGDRFENNIAITKKYMEIKPNKQVLLSNGEFIEAGFMSGSEPVLFIGRTNVPDSIKKYIQENDIEVGVLVGNELIGTATTIRRQVGISVFVKFAQGSRTPSGSIAPVEDLDRFPMPRYNLNMDIVSVAYNKGTGGLEVTYQNLVDLASYFKSTITVQDGQGLKVLGDPDPVFIDAQEYKTVVYTTASDGTPLSIQTGNATAQVFTIYGEGKKSLEFTVEKTLNIETITLLDNADIEIRDLVYNTQKKQFEVQIASTGNADAYVRVELIDVMMNDAPSTLGNDGVVLVKKGATTWIPIKAVLADVDLAANPELLVHAYFGERETALVKLKTGRFAMKEKAGDYILYILIAAVIVLILLFLFTRKKRCPKCGARNKKKATHCKKCGAPLYERQHRTTS
jgi:hypothetical protein